MISKQARLFVFLLHKITTSFIAATSNQSGYCRLHS